MEQPVKSNNNTHLMCLKNLLVISPPEYEECDLGSSTNESSTADISVKVPAFSPKNNDILIKHKGKVKNYKSFISELEEDFKKMIQLAYIRKARSNGSSKTTKVTSQYLENTPKWHMLDEKIIQEFGQAHSTFTTRNQPRNKDKI